MLNDSGTLATRNQHAVMNALRVGMRVRMHPRRIEWIVTDKDGRSVRLKDSEGTVVKWVPVSILAMRYVVVGSAQDKSLRDNWKQTTGGWGLV